MQKLTFISGNIGKMKEVMRFLKTPIEHVSLDITEIQSLSSEDIVKDKAERAYKALGKPVLVEDVSFVITCMGGLPGPLIKWFEKEIGTEGLCRLADGKDRACIGSVLFGYHDGVNIHLFEGSMSGTVALHPCGENSFGWGSIFIPEGLQKTYAELTDDEQSVMAMRRIALEKLDDFLGQK